MLVAIMCLSLTFGISGCKTAESASGSSKISASSSQIAAEFSSQATKEPSSQIASEPAESHYPVTVTTYDQNGEPVEQTFASRPERVVSISQANTEILLYLGLGDLIVGTAHRTSTPWGPTAKEYESLNFMAQDAYPSKEAVIALNPDIIIGWGSLFAEDALGPVQNWNELDIGTYLMKNTVSGLGKRNFDYLVEDIENVGKILTYKKKAMP